MTTLSFDCSPPCTCGADLYHMETGGDRPHRDGCAWASKCDKGEGMTPEREQAIRDWLERQAFNDSEGLACARDLMDALDQERARVAELEEPQFSKPGDLPGWVTLPQEEYEGLADRIAELGDLPAQLERWQTAAYQASERADALHEQKLDLHAIIDHQEEELEQARSREVALELRAEQARVFVVAWHLGRPASPHLNTCDCCLCESAREWLGKRRLIRWEDEASDG